MKKRTIILITAVVTAAVGTGLFAWNMRGSAAQAVNATPLSAGEKYLAELDYEKATAALEQAISIEPNNTEAYLALARTYNFMGDMDTARETLENGYSEQKEDREAGSEIPSAVDHIEIAGRSFAADTKELVLRNCGLTDADMAKLTGFTELERLDISGNGISDISVVGQLTKLQKFYAANNAIQDVSSLGSLTSLEYAGLRGNQIADADVLFELGSLRYLHLSDNQITSVSGLGSSLKLLYLANNRLGDTAVIQNAGLLYYDIDANGGM